MGDSQSVRHFLGGLIQQHVYRWDYEFLGEVPLEIQVRWQFETAWAYVVRVLSTGKQVIIDGVAFDGMESIPTVSESLRNLSPKGFSFDIVGENLVFESIG